MAEAEHLVPYTDLPIWCTARATCPGCGKVEVMVYPVEMARWQCACGHWNPAPLLPHEPAGKDLR
jgi:lysyl-tRNA synthetase class I